MSGSLRSLFMASARCREAAMRIRMGPEVYLATRKAIWKGPPDKEDAGLKDGRQEPIEGLPELVLTDPSRLRPEVQLAQGHLEWPKDLWEPDAHLFPVGKPSWGVPPGMLIAGGDADGVLEERACIPYREQDARVMAEMPLKWYRMPEALKEAMASGGGLPDVVRIEFVPTMLGGSLTLVLTSDEEQLCLIPLNETRENLEISLADGRSLHGDGWNDRKETFKTLKVRRKKMEGLRKLKNPLTTTPAEVQGQVKASSVVAAVDPQEPDVASALSSSVDSVIVEEPVEVQESPVTETRVEDPKEEKKTRVRKESGPAIVPGIDIKKLIEAFGKPVDPISIDQIATVDAYASDLRDLMIALARRMRNIGSRITEVARPAAEKLAALQDILK